MSGGGGCPQGSVDHLRSIGFIPGAPQRAPVAELVDAPDSKSGFLTEVLVRVRPGAPSLRCKLGASISARWRTHVPRARALLARGVDQLCKSPSDKPSKAMPRRRLP